MNVRHKAYAEPRWQGKEQLITTAIPSHIACWLFDSASLTARLINACPGRFHVKLSSQSWEPPHANEAHRLGIRRKRYAWIRQVLLYCDDTPWVFARTVIPQRTLRGRESYLTQLGNKPLGALLFADPTMRREPLEIAQLHPHQTLYREAVAALQQPPPCIWGRRSVFYLHHKPLLVNEFFLPDIGHCP